MPLCSSFDQRSHDLVKICSLEMCSNTMRSTSAQSQVRSCFDHPHLQGELLQHKLDNNWLKVGCPDRLLDLGNQGDRGFMPRRRGRCLACKNCSQECMNTSNLIWVIASGNTPSCAPALPRFSRATSRVISRCEIENSAEQQTVVALIFMPAPSPQSSCYLSSGGGARIVCHNERNDSVRLEVVPGSPSRRSGRG